jgi:hypothetical protein
MFLFSYPLFSLSHRYHFKVHGVCISHLSCHIISACALQFQPHFKGMHFPKKILQYSHNHSIFMPGRIFASIPILQGHICDACSFHAKPPSRELGRERAAQQLYIRNASKKFHIPGTPHSCKRRVMPSSAEVSHQPYPHS